MMNLCISSMPKGVGHRCAAPWYLGTSLYSSTSDASRRLKKKEVQLTSSEKTVLDSWSNLAVTLGRLQWVSEIAYWRFSKNFTIWDRKPISSSRSALIARINSKNSGSALIGSISNFNDCPRLKNHTFFCRTASLAIWTLANRWIEFCAHPPVLGQFTYGGSSLLGNLESCCNKFSTFIHFPKLRR